MWACEGSMGINQRVSLRKFVDDIRRWVEDGKNDDWIASALGTSPSSVQSFRSRNGIYRRDFGSTLYSPREYNSYEGTLETREPGAWFDPGIGEDTLWKSRWGRVNRVEVHVTPTRIVLTPRQDSGRDPHPSITREHRV